MSDPCMSCGEDRREVAPMRCVQRSGHALSAEPPRYRVGRHLGRTIYDGDRLIGMMDTPEIGALVVEALNARHRVLAKPTRDGVDPLQRCNPETGYHSTPHRGCMLR